MKGADVVTRALSACGQETIYRMGRGGFHPDASSPADPKDHTCDCSGFAPAWTHGLSRFVTKEHPLFGIFPGQWLETTKIYEDATSPTPRAYHARPWPDAAPGDLLVYGDGPGHQGHIAVVSAIGAFGPLKIVHCSRGNFTRHGDAIWETPIDEFWQRRQAVVVRCCLIDG